MSVIYVLDTTTNQATIDQRGIVGSSFTGSAAQGLTPGHQFIWYVLAFSTNDLAYNNVPGQTFSLATLPVPNLTGPTGTIAQNTPTFTWSAVSAGTRYAVYVLDLTTNLTPTGIVYTSAPSLMLATPFTRGRSYRWWVASVSANGSLVFVGKSLDFTVDP